MFCSSCGTKNEDRAERCVSCTAVIQHVPRRLGDDPVMRMLLPVGRSGWAIAAGYAGLFAMLLLPAPVALILGIVAVIDIRKHPQRHGMGRAIFGIVMGVAGTAVLVFMLVAQ